MGISGLELTPMRSVDQINKDHEEIGSNLLKGLHKPYQPRSLETPKNGTSGFSSFQGKDGYSYTTNYTYAKGEDGKYQFDSEVTVYDPKTKAYIDPQTLPQPNRDLEKANKIASAKKAELSASSDQLSSVADQKGKARTLATAEADKAGNSAAKWTEAAEKSTSPKAEYMARKTAKSFADKEVGARKKALDIADNEVSLREKALGKAKDESSANPKDAKLKKKVAEAEKNLGTAKAYQREAKASYSAAVDRAKADDSSLKVAEKKVKSLPTPAPKKPTPKSAPGTSVGEPKVA